MSTCLGLSAQEPVHLKWYYWRGQETSVCLRHVLLLFCGFYKKKSLSNLSLEMLIISNGHFPLMNDSEPWCFEFTNHKLWNINFLTAFTLIFQVVCYWNDCESCFQIRYGQSQNAFTFESFLCKLNIPSYCF